MRQRSHPASLVNQCDRLTDAVRTRLARRQPQQSHASTGWRAAQHAVLEHAQHQRRPAGVALPIAVQVVPLQAAAHVADGFEHQVDVFAHEPSRSVQSRR